MTQNQNGFGIVGFFLIFIVLGIIAFAGWTVFNKPDAKQSNATPTTSTKTNTTDTRGVDANVLVIPEWNVQLQKNDGISSGTVKVVSDNTYFGEVAFLSTDQLNTSAECKQYYSADIPTFQYIVRYKADDRVSLDEGLTNISAREAAEQLPKNYRSVGDYVYNYKHGNGSPCAGDEGAAVFDGFTKAFETIAPYKK